MAREQASRQRSGSALVAAFPRAGRANASDSLSQPATPSSGELSDRRCHSLSVPRNLGFVTLALAGGFFGPAASAGAEETSAEVADTS